MIIDLHPKSKYNLNNSAQKPDTRSKRRISHPGIGHKLLRKPGQNLNKDGMTSLSLSTLANLCLWELNKMLHNSRTLGLGKMYNWLNHRGQRTRIPSSIRQTDCSTNQCQILHMNINRYFSRILVYESFFYDHLYLNNLVPEIYSLFPPNS